MQLGMSRPAPADDVAAALTVSARDLGHRPALTVLSEVGREEQSFVSLHQWAAKGAHLLQLDHDLGPGDRVLVAGPTGWLPFAVCLAVWWCGGHVVDTAPFELAVVHESVAEPGGPATYRYGHHPDGTADEGQSWATEVQAFPDQPPPATADGALPALTVGARRWTQADLLTTEHGHGRLGVATSDAAVWLPAAAAALRSGRNTVLLRGVPRDVADGEGVGTWLT